ncbi:hypothetical protein QBC39DRAFT_162517 [Podospora conica]|nr:hypothetical protein QBC39DRAFT_162517 [Schizothecium conicum]
MPPQPPQQEFLFVNPGNKTRGGHKISTKARAFVIRNARAAQPWSTKSAAHGPVRRRQESQAVGDSRFDEQPQDGQAETSSVLARKPARVSTRPNRIARGRATRSGSSAAVAVAVAPCLTAQQTGGPAAAALSRPLQCNSRSPRTGHSTIWIDSSAAVDLWTQSHIFGRFNAFSSLAVPVSGPDATLLEYFNNAIAPRLTPQTKSDEVERYWMSTSFSHSAFLHSLLCLSSLQMAVDGPNRCNFLVLERFMHHRGEAIAAINSNLADPVRSISDENIAAVFNLLCIEENLYMHAPGALAHQPMWEHLEPNAEKRQTHMTGLKQMLAMRGGVGHIGKARGLQSFILRWVCTAVACRIIFTLPQSYEPGLSCDPDQEQASQRAFAASHLLPHNLLSDLYDYPAASRSWGTTCEMADSCFRHGMHAELATHFRVIDCILKDLKAWTADPTWYGWDALDMQNILSIAIGELTRWFLVNEADLSPFDHVMAMTLFIFIFIVGLGAHTACSPVPGILPRMRKQFLDPTLKPTLRAAGVDAWVALFLLIASTQNREWGEYFFRYYIETLNARSPPVKSYQDFQTTIEKCLWMSDMDFHLAKAWDEIQGEWERLREILPFDPTALKTATRPNPGDMYAHKFSIPMGSPYSTAHMRTLFSARPALATMGVF